MWGVWVGIGLFCVITALIVGVAVLTARQQRNAAIEEKVRRRREHSDQFRPHTEVIQKPQRPCPGIRQIVKVTTRRTRSDRYVPEQTPHGNPVISQAHVESDRRRKQHARG